ncbi:efflux RND transporter periplasmic adaptor subunit [Pigmentiphaga sp. GD03639]|uniref:efflux RND transporter periplasmic adaptor subunit n=1 Tax=unclassified Pigmentiphaga TaxID=2626614 RepID=UPI000B40C340|nr:MULTISPECIES: efflux RND transporter periplasmic adaptor subunit [unclassified Pigmentiphaga]MDH2238444.1 efflux RND transporter periplasmic adaptor subunit [Pigmentiphaga sp. GD03639]OVZ65416.1 efflux transporter periplasmic adaptor subunit [Pigmentiphaga sp. NML030171]
MRKKILVGTAILAAVVLAGVRVAASGGDEPPPAAYPAPKVAVASVQRARLPRVYVGVGELEAVRQVLLATEAGGRITRIAFESGQRVKAGQVLVQLNDAPEQAEARRLEAQLRNAELQHARVLRLLEEDAATREQLDNARAARDMAQGELQRVQALIAQKTVRAPFDGVLGLRRVHAGQYLNVADPIASLVDAASLRANFSLDEQAVPRLRAGQPVEVLVDAYPGRRFRATINAIDPMISRSRTVRVQATLPNPEGALKAGMYASVRVERQDGPASVLAVPETAVTYTAYGDTVFVVQDAPGKGLVAKRVAVKVGARHEGLVEIEEGLRESDRVVTSGQLKLNDGMPVEPSAGDTLRETVSATRVSGI